jgi:hypothetical protein
MHGHIMHGHIMYGHIKHGHIKHGHIKHANAVYYMLYVRINSDMSTDTIGQKPV